MITVRNLSKIFGSGEGKVTALNDVNIEIADGEVVAITGKSGSGKTTLLNILGRLDTATEGSVLYDDVDIMKLSENAAADFRLNEIGFVFQFYDLLPELTAEENILLPSRLSGKKTADLTALSEKLGISDRLKYYPSQLSGGQQQRAAIARALINSPKVLLCDEPTGNLDEKSGEEVMELLSELNRSYGCTVVIVTHNSEIADRCGRIIRIADGKIVSDVRKE